MEMSEQKKGRPKGEKKERINLTISKEALDKGKKTARHLNKSLSGFTENAYQDLHDNFFGLDKNPEQMLKHFQKQIKDMEDVYKNKLKKRGIKRNS